MSVAILGAVAASAAAALSWLLRRRRAAHSADELTRTR
jgi:hypothetical protein